MGVDVCDRRRPRPARSRRHRVAAALRPARIAGCAARPVLTRQAPTAGAVGVGAGAGAYALWGLLTLYWPLLAPAAAVEILAHRIVWALLVVSAALLIRRRWGWLRSLLRQPRALAALAAAAVAISINWGLFIWAVTHRHVVEASLGYYINPLVSVLLGVLVLRERLDGMRWAAVGLAAAGVAWLTIDYGAPPWISLTLAFSFGTYGLLKKLATVGALESLAVETAIVSVPALGYLLWLGPAGAFGSAGPGTDLLLASSGLATAVPLLLFGMAAARIPLSTVGMLQYLTPTLQLLIGVFVFAEPVDAREMVGFALVWAALLLLSTATLHRRRAARQAVPEAVALHRP
ncbi:MAG: EamA family transporter RarD [Pseudonocardiaceae bacterium]|nr:EamA family transporter RarD [Pseudonocardiaceae bacterium]